MFHSSASLPSPSGASEYRADEPLHGRDHGNERKRDEAIAIHQNYLMKIDNPGAFSARRNFEGVSAPAETRNSSIKPT